MAKNEIYQIKVTLKDSKPPIWRRIQVRADTKLNQLHLILQVIMGWADYHLHQFVVGETYFGEPHPDDWHEVNDERKVTLSQIVPREGFKFIYEYDFGDDWRHELLIEKILPPEPGVEYPLCLKGKRAGPPEDVGGVWGYDDFLAAIKDPHHDEHQDMLEWVGGEFDPEAFDPDEVNAVLRQRLGTQPVVETTGDYPAPVAQLLSLGDVRDQPQWADYPALGLTLEHTPDLIRMALDEDLNWADSDTDEVWAPIHAWRALGQLRAEAAIEPLMSLFGRVDEFDDDWVGEDLPDVFGLIGRPALEPLSRYLANPDHSLWARVTAAQSFVKIGRRHPELRTQCVAALTRQLEQFRELSPSLNAFLVSSLIDLKAVESAPVMEQAFAAGRVDISVPGDWEDTQIELGLLRERQTPRPNYHEPLGRPLSPPVGKNRGGADAQAKNKLKAQKKAKEKARTKRKQQKKARKKQRKR
ncbi:MAG: DUF1186 domain-containing protein [Anaerolineae bacterium]|nr:DUF1186 domain-containing protein [Anaerolineae bacterium]